MQPCRGRNKPERKAGEAGNERRRKGGQEENRKLESRNAIHGSPPIEASSAWMACHLTGRLRIPR